MENVFRIGSVLCILLVLGMFVGCGDDDPVAVDPPNVVVNEAGSIGIYADTDGQISHLVDTGGMITLHVVHVVNDGATAAAFRIEEPPYRSATSTMESRLLTDSVCPGRSI